MSKRDDMDARPLILHVASSFPTDVDVFDGDHVQKYIEVIKDDMQHVIVHAQKDRRQKRFSYRIHRAKQNGITTHIIYYRPWFWRWNTLAHCRALHVLCREIVHQKAIHLVHVHGVFPGALYAWFIKRYMGFRFLITEHSSFFLKNHKHWRERFKRKVAKFLFNSSEVVLPVSPTLSEGILDLGVTATLTCIPNPIPNHFFSTLRQEAKKETFDLIHLSNATDEVKNISGMLRAVEAASKKCPNLRLTMVLNGNVDWVKEQLFIYNLLKFVTILSNVPNNEIPVLMSRHDALVHFSNYETFGIVLAEAWAVGLPVISTDFGGVAAYIDTNMGIKIAIGDERALAVAIYSMQQNYDYEPTVIKSFCKRRFSADMVSEAIDKVYGSLSRVIDI